MYYNKIKYLDIKYLIALQILKNMSKIYKLKRRNLKNIT